MPRARIRRCQVAIVGAGLAGLSAAKTLSEAGVDVVVVEARDRVGGRTLSQEVGGAVFDLGGQWIGPGQHRVAALAKALGVKTFPTWASGTKVLDLKGEIKTYEGQIPSVGPLNLLGLQLLITRTEGMVRRTSPLAPASTKEAQRLDGMTVESWKMAHVRSPVARGLLDAACRVVFGAEPSRLSMLYFLAYLSAADGLESVIEIEGGAQQDRFVGGAQQLAEGLARPLGDRLVLSAPVSAIEQDGAGVSIKAAGVNIKASYAILAVPPAMLPRIQFTPDLPPGREHLVQAQSMGATVKAMAIYERPFWRDAGFSGEAVATAGPLTVVFDNTDVDGKAPCLLGFIVGGQARTWHRRPEALRREAVLSTLARYFGDEALRPRAYREQDWSTEPFTRGCPVAHLPPGVLSTLGAGLREPVGRLHWAGTETAVSWTGYMEGALESGERAAAELLGRGVAQL